MNCLWCAPDDRQQIGNEMAGVRYMRGMDALLCSAVDGNINDKPVKFTAGQSAGSGDVKQPARASRRGCKCSCCQQVAG
ncbi:hypothetical protein ABBQ38_002822 [Trebouxia sp. C0009 RCD-2024]